MVADHEIQVFAGMRSGHHAIIHWVMCHYPGVVLFRNNVLGAEKLIYRNASREYIKRDKKKPQRKECYVLNLEDCLACESARVLAHDPRLAWGRSGSVHRLLVLRDPYNFFASRLRGRLKIPVYFCEDWVELWKSHAREFLRLTQFLPDLVPVSYNQWVRDVDYRRRLASRLGRDHTDAGLEYVPDLGFGSSFDGRDFDGRAQQMPVLSRWRNVARDAEFLALIADPELQELAYRIFGDADGLPLPGKLV